MNYNNSCTLQAGVFLLFFFRTAAVGNVLLIMIKVFLDREAGHGGGSSKWEFDWRDNNFFFFFSSIWEDYNNDGNWNGWRCTNIDIIAVSSTYCTCCCISIISTIIIILVLNSAYFSMMIFDLVLCIVLRI